ncbi:hypothetical protein ALO68_102275 [Pseudomonas syringae pv. helianthi]|uniref:Uncharacterized protein n=2 Tax=Pseudomonas syringae group genomosp. 7 TaxID=251699 RepID=A0A0N8RPS8_9PSED|nr:hypothetical protein ALO68_102275 [Pseudomonas syringae pv. helianthi]KPY82301.1 hypothetical protein ALO44_102157 [Pseudomonas syringae pv. tagetis]RMR04462.1 hypothetical protein ALP93_101719 [Pseudomonas syringae pv. helianthi]RMW16231.1 hypothetical protein ALO98_101782 [Pseudomonas syringae pv. tagetis]RMW27594.1 hypothetical protein ALO97_102009 [Pseudomonas syringae pv. tagetis]
MRSWVRMRSESTSAFGQPSETNPTLGADGVVTVDMANLGVKGTRAQSAGADWALAAPLIKKCAILAVSGRDDQRLDENYDVRETRERADLTESNKSRLTGDGYIWRIQESERGWRGWWHAFTAWFRPAV